MSSKDVLVDSNNVVANVNIKGNKFFFLWEKSKPNQFVE